MANEAFQNETIPVPFQGQTVPESVRARIMAAQLLQRTAAQAGTPYTSKGIALAHGLLGGIGGLVEGSTISNEEAAQTANRADQFALSQAIAARMRAGTWGNGAASSGQPSAAAGTPTPAAGSTPYLARLAQVESSNNPASPGPGTSDATGLYQFTGPTWSRLMQQYPSLGLTADGRTDPTQQNRAIQAFTGENASALGRAGLQATPGNLYLAHFAGAGGATAALNADPNTPVAQVLGPQAVAANPFLRGKTAGDLVGWANTKMAGVDPSTVPGAAPTTPPRPQAAAPTAPPPGPTALAAPSPDMPAPNAQPAGSASLPPGITPDMVSAPPQQPRSLSDIVSGAMSKAGYDPADLPAPSAQPTGSAALPPGITPDMISGGSDQAPAPAPDMVAAAMAKAGYPMGGDSPDVPAPGAQDAGSSTLPPGITPDQIGPGQGAASALPPLQPVPGPSGPDDPANATDYALSPSGTRDQYAPSVAIGGLPPADANEGPKPVTFNPAMMGPSTSADANGNQPFNLAPNPNGFTPPQQLPQTGPMPPLGGQSRAAIAAQILQGQKPISADLNPASTPAGVLSAREAGVSLGPPPTQPAIPPNASSLAPPPGPSPMAAAPGQQAISGAMNPGGQAAPSQQALAAALLQRGAGGLAPPSGNSPMSDPSSALNFNRQQMAAQMLANPSGAPAPAAPQGAPMVGPGPGPTPGPAIGPSPQALANGLAPGSAPPPPQPVPMNAGPQPAPAGVPPQGAPPAPGQAAPQSGGFLSSIFGGGQPQPAPATTIPTNPADLQALYAKVAQNPRTSPQFLAQLQQQMMPQLRTEKMENGDLVQVDDRGLVAPRVIYSGGQKADWHFDPTSGLSSNAATGAVRRGAPPAPFTSSIKVNGLDVPVYVTPDPNGGPSKVVPLVPGAGGSGGGQGQAPAGPITFGTPPQGGPAASPAAGPQSGAPSPFGPQVQSLLDAGNKQAQAQEAAKANAKNDSDQIADSRTKLEGLRQGAIDINQAGQALASFKGQMPTGPLGETALQLRGLANTFGLGDPAQLANMEIFAKNATKAATAQIKDVTNRATNLDMQVELKNNPGINVSDQTNRILIDHLQRANALAQEYEQAKQGYYDQNGSLQGFQSQWQNSLSGATARPLTIYPSARKTVGGQTYVKLLSTDPSGYSWHPEGEVQ